ncbi:MAG: PAS domain S-box-containing protein [Halobacteriales archaeon]|jgi:PAS domain S-box-containing protein
MTSDQDADGDVATEDRSGSSTVQWIQQRVGSVVPDMIRRNLTAKLLLLLFVGTVISGGVLYVSYVTINEEITGQVESQVESETTVQATVYENWLTERWTTLNAMARADEIQHESRSVVHQWLVAERTGVSNDVHSLHVVNPETGEIFGSTNTKFQGRNLYDRGLDQQTTERLIFISKRPVLLAEDLPKMTIIGVRSGDRLLVAAIPSNTTLVELQAYEGGENSLRSLEGRKLIGTSSNETIELRENLETGTVVTDRGKFIMGVRVISHDVLDAEAVDRRDEETAVQTVVVTRAPKTQAFAVRDEISRLLVVAFGLTFILLIGTAAVSMRSVTGAVNRLSERARRVSEGSFDVNVSSDRLDEIGTLYRSVGDMRDSLQQRVNMAKERERKMEAARNEADQAREELRQVIDLVPDLIFARDSEGRYLLANEATAAGYGMTPEEIEGKRVEELRPGAEQPEGFREEDQRVIESGEQIHGNQEVVRFDGEKRIHQTTKIPFKPMGDDEDAVLGYARDVTELKEYEQQLETQLDNLDVLNKMVRHDIRNEIQVVRAYAESLESHVDDEGEEYVEQVLDGARAAAEITETARDVAEVMVQADAELAPVGFRSVLEGEIEDVRSSHEAAVVIVDGSIPDVQILADDMFGSVARNLLNNAIVHNDKDVPQITVTATETEENVLLRVADNGPGIADDRKERIFDEGEQGLDSNGTGLGLYLVQTLVDRYEGEVWVEDSDPTGAVFFVELPVHSSRTAFRNSES